MGILQLSSIICGLSFQLFYVITPPVTYFAPSAEYTHEAADGILSLQL